MIIDRHNNITMVKGDTAHLTVDIYNVASASGYTVQSEDELTLRLRQKHKCDGATFEKSVVGSNQIDLAPEDTRELPHGAYVYSIALKSGEDRYTIAQANIDLLPEV